VFKILTWHCQLQCNNNRELRHPNIITLMGACKHVNQLLIIMNYVDDMVAILIKPFFKIPLWLVCLQWECNLVYETYFQMEAVHISSLAKQVTRALAYMHSHDPVVIHQDLKPANVMVRTCIARMSFIFHYTGFTRISRICV
jgi:serine/threonine protein kinase